jgi:hypothetical protein
MADAAGLRRSAHSTADSPACVKHRSDTAMTAGIGSNSPDGTEQIGTGPLLSSKKDSSGTISEAPLSVQLSTTSRPS